jgi:hypothetical protein
MVDDNKLNKVLWALDGLIAGMPQIVPVRGAKVKKEANGSTKVVATSEAAAKGSLWEAVLVRVKQWQYDDIRYRDLLALTLDAGGKNGTVGSIITNLVGRGVLAPLGKGNYHINKGV